MCARSLNLYRNIMYVDGKYYLIDWGISLNGEDENYGGDLGETSEVWWEEGEPDVVSA